MPIIQWSKQRTRTFTWHGRHTVRTAAWPTPDPENRKAPDHLPSVLQTLKNDSVRLLQYDFWSPGTRHQLISHAQLS
ncbi:hypothetical protein RR48_09994 [Papilio machaon]|uniref:Uncharacterized protein n=1 Tax=Papilio machaon TaxID=76193 RepID=A0A194RDN0_PAPMA|nr:hypothetical protein RR48_09994 [Papilio machaon]